MIPVELVRALARRLGAPGVERGVDILSAAVDVWLELVAAGATSVEVSAVLVKVRPDEPDLAQAGLGALVEVGAMSASLEGGEWTVRVDVPKAPSSEA